MSEVAPKAGSDLGTRFAAAVVMVAVACAAIYAGGWWFYALVAAGAALMMVEWGDIHGLRRGWSGAAAALAVGALMVAAWRLFDPGDSCDVDGAEELARQCLDPAWLGAAGLFAAAALLGVFARRLSLFTGFLYVTIPAFALIVLEWSHLYFVLWAMLVTWATDIFAYFAGRAIGGPKLAPRISPNKTWAGLIGGMAGAAAVGAAWAIFAGLGSPFTWAGGLMGLLAQMGDLYESSLKRRFGVKDSGTLIPGHGGILDRVDGLLPVAVATLLLLMVTLSR